jgi:glycosyltransferase involved in cell wall biosynthesis
MKKKPVSKILIVTQKVDINDADLGFFHDWIREFALNFDEVLCLCLQRGDYALAPNVRVYSLGKENRATKLSIALRFLRLVWRHRREYDAVFVHMNPEYVLLAGVLWRLLGKPIYLWYVHWAINARLWIAQTLVNGVFSVSKNTWPLSSAKLVPVGHGINVAKFLCKSDVSPDAPLLYVGRISRVKSIDVLLDAMEALNHGNGSKYRLTIVGEAITEKDKNYLTELKRHSAATYVSWVGPVKHDKIGAHYCASRALVNLSPNLQNDKVVYEAFASGRPVLLSNESFRSLLAEEANYFMYQHKNPTDLARAILNLDKIPSQALAKVRERVRSTSDLSETVRKIKHVYQASK